MLLSKLTYQSVASKSNCTVSYPKEAKSYCIVWKSEVYIPGVSSPCSFYMLSYTNESHIYKVKASPTRQNNHSLAMY